MKASVVEGTVVSFVLTTQCMSYSCGFIPSGIAGQFADSFILGCFVAPFESKSPLMGLNAVRV